MATDIKERLRDKALTMEAVKFSLCAQLYREAACHIEQLEAKATVPEGLIDRVNAALRRIEENRAPRRIPADPTDVDLVLSEVLMLLKGKYERPFWVVVQEKI